MSLMSFCKSHSLQKRQFLRCMTLAKLPTSLPSQGGYGKECSNEAVHLYFTKASNCFNAKIANGSNGKNTLHERNDEKNARNIEMQNITSRMPTTMLNIHHRAVTRSHILPNRLKVVLLKLLYRESKIERNSL